MEPETHFIDLENSIYQSKIDLFKKSEQLVGFKVICYERVVDVRLDDDNNPTFEVRKLEEDDKTLILKEGFKNVGKQWTNDDVKQLKPLFESEDGDLLKISQKLERTEKSVRMKLFFLDIIDEDEVIWMKKIPQRPPKPNKKKGKVWTKDEDEKLINLYEKYDEDIVKISKEMKREERSVRMKLFFLDMIIENDVAWMDKIHKKDY